MEVYLIDTKKQFCDGHTTLNFTIGFGINLPVARAFNAFTPSSPAATIDNEPYFVDIPNTDTLFDNLDTDLQKQAALGLDLATAAANIIQNDKIRRQHQFPQILSKTCPYIPAVISLVLSSILLYKTYTLNRRLERWIKFVSMAANLPSASAFLFNMTHHEIPRIVPGTGTAPPASSQSDPLYYPGPLPAGLAMIILQVLPLMAFRLARACRRRTVPAAPTGSWIYLTLTTARISYEFPVRPVNHAINSINVLATPPVLSMGSKFLWRARESMLLLNWMGQLKYVVDGVTFSMKFPPALRIDTQHIRGVKKALAGRDYMMSLVTRDTYGHHIQLTPDAQHHVSDIHAGDNAASLYWCVFNNNYSLSFVTTCVRCINV